MIDLRKLKINEKGNLEIGGVDATELAKEYGTPAYIMDEEQILQNCRAFKSSIDKHYDGLAVYASKAFNCLEMCRIIKREGLGIDVVSGGEMYTALKAGINAEVIVFHGNNKIYSELKQAVEIGIGRIVVDNLGELKTLENIAKTLGKKANIMLRLKPGIDVHTHEYIKTGQIDSKFGFSIETGEAFYAVKQAVQNENLNLVGVHCHIGSQIFEITPFADAAEIMLNFMHKVQKELKYKLRDLNLGGGFGIRYTLDDDPPKYAEYMEQVYQRIEKVCKKLNLDVPYILIEPGRAIVGEAGVTIYTVGNVKNIPNYRTYVSVDGGMTDNPRYALYSAKYTALVANKMNEDADFVATLAGRCCESGDLLGEGMLMQQPEAGDIIAVFSTGAYNYSMASNYNKIPKAPVVFVNSGKSRLVVKGQSYEDMCRLEI
ncbi:MAG: diaminopimelate decarboxylase [Clostridia bacterium]